MTKFTEKSLHSYPMAFYYAAMKAMDDRTAAVETALERFLTMETEFHRLFTAFDVAYKNSLKSQLTDTIKQKDDERDHNAYVMERVAKLWGEKLDDQSRWSSTESAWRRCSRTSTSARRRRWWLRTRRFRTWNSGSRLSWLCRPTWRQWD